VKFVKKFLTHMRERGKGKVIVGEKIGGIAGKASGGVEKRGSSSGAPLESGCCGVGKSVHGSGVFCGCPTCGQVL
jgi:hypothetical protein